MAEKKKAQSGKPQPKTEAMPAPTAPAAPSSRRTGIFKPTAPRRALVSALASATKTAPVVLAAIKAAYGWTDKTRLTRPEFLRRRDEWLARPASEV